LNRILTVQVPQSGIPTKSERCDATGEEQSNEVGFIKILLQKLETMVNGISVDCDYKTTIKNDKDV